MDAPLPPDPRQQQQSAQQQQQQMWLEACKACQGTDLSSIRRFFNAGGMPSRRLLGSEARLLCRELPDCFSEGEALNY